MKFITTMKLAGAALALSLLSVGAASASVLTPGLSKCDLNETDHYGIELTSGTGTYVDCAGSFEGNDDNQDYENYINAQFGTTGTWSKLTKVDNSGTAGGLTVVNNGATGTFTFGGYNGDVVFVLKGANCFSAFYFSGVSGTIHADYSTIDAGLNKGNCDGDLGPGLSHLTVYTGGAVPIPVPAAGFLLLAGLGGLVAVRRRKTA